RVRSSSMPCHKDGRISYQVLKAFWKPANHWKKPANGDARRANETDAQNVPGLRCQGDAGNFGRAVKPNGNADHSNSPGSVNLSVVDAVKAPIVELAPRRQEQRTTHR